MSDLEQKLKKRVETGDLDLPVLPTVGAQVLELSRDQESDAKDLAKLIQSDQSLAGYVMKVANSAAYSSVGQIQTLQQAIAKLGMQQIGQMALAVTVGQSVFKSEDATREIIRFLWKHSLACATWGREIARICRINTEVVFLSGLLHQIGKPVALHTVTSVVDGDETFPESEELLLLIEKYQKIIGVNLARRWNLPEPVVESINYIDDFYAAPSARMEVTVVHAARILADLTLKENGEGKIVTDNLVEPVFSELNLYEEDLQALVEKRESVGQLLDVLLL